MDYDTPHNPYRPLADESVILAPFAGRQKALDYLYQQLTNPAHPETAVILGGRGAGKSALLHRFDSFFDETFIGAYLPLAAVPLENERGWLLALAGALRRALLSRDYSLERVPDDAPPEGDAVRAWFAETYLPALSSLLRRSRRLILLLDDAHYLAKALQSEKLPGDSAAFLRDLLAAHPALGAALTLDIHAEASLTILSPLVNPAETLRLNNLAPDETIWLLSEPVKGRYTISEAAGTAVQAAAGGHPQLLQRFGFHLFRLWEANPGHNTITPADVKQVSQAVYAQSEDEFAAAWAQTGANERLVLRAMCGLLYADPLGKLDTSALERWLVETDHPLDATAINAALRSLEYREIVSVGADGLRFTSGLMQTWMLEHTRAESETTASTAWRGGKLTLPLVAAAALLVVVVVLIAALSATPRDETPSAPEPTVTLVEGEGE